MIICPDIMADYDNMGCREEINSYISIGYVGFFDKENPFGQTRIKKDLGVFCLFKDM